MTTTSRAKALGIAELMIDSTLNLSLSVKSIERTAEDVPKEAKKAKKMGSTLLVNFPFFTLVAGARFMKILPVFSPFGPSRPRDVHQWLSCHWCELTSPVQLFARPKKWEAHR